MILATVSCLQTQQPECGAENVVDDLHSVLRSLFLYRRQRRGNSYHQFNTPQAAHKGQYTSQTFAAKITDTISGLWLARQPMLLR
jgi:hypothetical protein